jgi:hypothetical protein
MKSVLHWVTPFGDPHGCGGRISTGLSCAPLDCRGGQHPANRNGNQGQNDLQPPPSAWPLRAPENKLEDGTISNGLSRDLWK